MRNLLVILLTLVFSTLSTSCLMFKDEPLFACDDDSDCEGGEKCTSSVCRPSDWCEYESHCNEGELCIGGVCMVSGEEGGVCIEDEDCGPLTCINGVCRKLGGSDGYCQSDRECDDGHVCSNEVCTCEGGGEEVCNGIDDDCDGSTDEDLAEGTLSCGEGECTATVATECRDGVETVKAVCEPLDPTNEVCDGLDNDCNGETDDGLGTVSCGEGECAVEMDACTNGQETVCVPAEPTDDICDGLDNDCDGQIDNNPDFRFTIQNDVAIDNCEGITWQLGHSDVVGDRDTGLEYCFGLGLDGKSDWRLPRSGDYSGILNGSSCAESPLCAALFPGDTETYWTSTSTTANLADGTLETTGTGDVTGGYFRCIRNTDPMAGLSDFCDDQAVQPYLEFVDGIVIDNCNENGLMWQQLPTEEEYTLSQSEAYCDALELGGYTDWRLPSTSSYDTILDNCTEGGWDYKSYYCSPCHESTLCNAMFGGEATRHWASLEYMVDFLSGDMSNGYMASSDFQVRCVRNNY